MKRLMLFFWFVAVSATGSPENLRFTEPFTIHIPANAGLDVIWKAPTNKIPSNVWIYQLSPRKLSKNAITKLMTACDLTMKDGTNFGNEQLFKSPDGSRTLQIIPNWGGIDFRNHITRSWTNLVKDVPSDSEAIKLAKKFLPQLGIRLQEIENKNQSSEPNFYVVEMGVTYFVNHQENYNVESREVRFRRAEDGISFAGAGSGGYGRIGFGSHGKISEIEIRWRTISRYKSYPTVTASVMIKSILEGKAIQGMLPDNSGGMDWKNVKTVTIKKAEPSYYGSGNPFSPSDWVNPYAALWATVETEHGNVDVEIDCPIIDEK